MRRKPKLYQAPSGRYWAKSIIDGVEHKQSFGYELREAEAARDAWWDSITNAMTRGTTLETLREADIRRAERDKCSPLHVDNIRQHFGHLIAYFGERFEVTKLSRKRLQAYGEARVEGGVSWTTAKRELATLRRAYDQVCGHTPSWWPNDKAVVGKKHKHQGKAAKYRTDKELSAFKKYANDKLMLLALIFKNTGMRAMEAQRLEPSWVVTDPEELADYAHANVQVAAILRIPDTGAKRKGRDIPICADVVEAIKALNYKIRWPRRRATTASECAGLNYPITPRDLRKTYGTDEFRRPDVSLADVSYLLGHTNIATTAIYLEAKRTNGAACLPNTL